MSRLGSRPAALSNGRCDLAKVIDQCLHLRSVRTERIVFLYEGGL
jgi:hypothetical protein